MLQIYVPARVVQGFQLLLCGLYHDGTVRIVLYALIAGLKGDVKENDGGTCILCSLCGIGIEHSSAAAGSNGSLAAEGLHDLSLCLTEEGLALLFKYLGYRHFEGPDYDVVGVAEAAAQFLCRELADS